jgi:hypothetical protein
MSGLAETVFASQTVHPSVGVYYYPGWRDNVLGNRSAHPWEDIRKFPEREPLIGYYREGDVTVMEQQVDQMADTGLDFVVFDWFWNDQLGALHTHSLEAFSNARNRSRLKFAFLWANHTEFPESVRQIEKMARAWTSYFHRPGYLRIDGKPVVVIMSVGLLEKRAARFHATAADLLGAIRRVARENDLPGVFIVGGLGARDPAIDRYSGLASDGFDAYSTYNYQGTGTRYYEGKRNVSHSYPELDAGYRDHWQWMMDHSPVPYIVPMTSGWDKRPWGGSPDPQHDNSQSTPEQFETHLRAAKELMLANPAKTLGMGVICCWNEWGEGSFIEPTKAEGDAKLRRVKRVFGPASDKAAP